MNKADLIEGVAKGMAILESFDTERQRLNATLAAQRAGITRTAARRYLLTLAHLGYLETDGGYYWLSPKVLHFSGNYLASARLPRAVQAILNQTSVQLQASLSVAVLNGAEVVIVARNASVASIERIQAYGLHLGARLPAHATSTGRVLLANLTKAALNTWLKEHSNNRDGTFARLTPYTTVDRKVLRQIIEQVRKDDYCVANDEHEIGVHALAVPLRNMRGETLAALNVVALKKPRVEAYLSQDVLPHLLDVARALRESL